MSVRSVCLLGCLLVARTGLAQVSPYSVTAGGDSASCPDFLAKASQKAADLIN